MMTKRLEEIDSLKGLAIIGVIVVHMNFFARFGEGTISAIKVTQGVFGWCVIAFFFCSGYLTKNQPFSWTDFHKFVRKKVLRLLLPCFIFSLSYKSFLIIISQLKIFAWEFKKPNNFLEILQFLVEPANPQFYFLPYLFFISVFLYFILMGLRHTWLILFLAFCAYTLFYFYSPPIISGHGPGYELLPIYTIAFLMGFSAQFNTFGKFPFIAFLICIATLGLCLAKNTYVYAYLLTPIILLSLLKKFSFLNALIAKTQLGQKSAAIYVWHQPLVMPFWSIAANKLSSNDSIKIFLTILLTVGTCYMADFLTKKVIFLKPWRI